MTGQTLSHFEILEKLGEGGMGVVYKARDTQLNRTASIKVLHAGLAADPERRRRFVQEARAASALNHPNIVTIYEIGQAEGVDFMAMEYVPGDTLDQLIPASGMPVAVALNHAVQIADALSAAHAAGITHRDLKPSNIMVTSDGRVKVLDFGLAKLTEPARAASESDATLTDHSPQTREGSVLGTVAYMSPEQAEGRTVDARSDIFSFGSVLYEMVTGRRAFRRDTPMATLVAVVKDEPEAVRRITPGAPKALETLIGACMRKAADQRAGGIGKVKSSLEEIREGGKSGGRPAWMLPAAAAGLAAAIGGAGWMINSRKAPEPAASTPPIVLTSYPGEESDPALSPDGKHVAFAWNGEKEDNFDIYVKAVDTGEPVRLTTDPAPEGAPVWSPDGNFIAFRRLTGGKGGFYVIPSAGGLERKVADIPTLPSHRGWPDFDWAPDGKSLIVVDTSATPAGLASVSLATGEKRILTVPPVKSFGDGGPRVSPDGKWLAFVRASHASVGDWYLAPLGSESPSEPKRLTHFNASGRGGAWSSSSDTLLVSLSSVTGRIWRVPLAGEPRLAADFSEGDTSPSIARHGGRLVFRRGYSDSNIWRASLKDPQAPPLRIIASTRIDDQADYTADGSRLVFLSSRTGTREIWTANADGSNPVRITTEGARPCRPPMVTRRQADRVCEAA